MEITLYRADCRGRQSNCLYPHEVHITSADEMKDAVERDHVCARYKDGRRSGENFLEASVAVMDCDNDHSDDPAEWITPEMLEAELPDVAFAVTYSRHHMKEKDGKAARPRFHVYFLCRTYKEADAYAGLKRRIQAVYPFFDKNCLDAARFIYGCDTDEVVWHEGEKTIEDVLEEQDEAFSAAEAIPQGERNATMSRYAGRVVKRFGHTDAAKAIFLEKAEKCSPPLSDGELDKIWASAGKFAKKVSEAPGYVPPEEFNAWLPQGPAGSLRPEDYSDIGQAKVLSREFGDELKYSPATDFLHYNGVYWDESLPPAVGAVEEFLDLQLADARFLVFEKKQAVLSAGLSKEEIGKRKPPKEADDVQLKAFAEYLDALGYLDFVMKHRDVRYIKAAMEAGKPMLFVEHTELDRDPFLLNTPEATYDLRLGMMGQMPHSPADLITKVTAVEPGEKGRDIWEKALTDTFCGDKELISYVQEVVGLAAIGKVFVEALIIAYGEGRNGKSTFFNTISRVLGSYSWTLSSDALVATTRRNTKWEVSELKGRRLVLAAELEEGVRLSTSMLKQITSTDEIQCEKKFKSPAPFIPSHTTILFTNHLPKVGAMDEGTWRRLIVIPFKAVFEKTGDRKNYADYLVENAGPAVLSWIIEGAERVIDEQYHLERPQVVQDAISAYRSENNWFSIYIAENCVIDEKSRVKASDLYDDYRAFCDRIGEYAHPQVEFSKAMVAAGYERKRMKNGWNYLGLRLQDELLDG